MTRATVIAGVIALLLLAAWAGFLLYESGHLSRAGLVALAEGSGPWPPLILMGVMVLAVVIGPIPTVPIPIASGAVLGPLVGFAYAMSGALIGAAVSFWIARLLGEPVMRRLFRGHIVFCADCSSRLLFLVTLVSRLLPVVSFVFVSYGAGLTAMRTRAFLLATAIGMVPMTALYVTAGTSLAANPGIAAIGGLVVVMLVLLLPLLIERLDPWGVRTWLARTAHGDADHQTARAQRGDSGRPGE